jgi:6-phosphogluconolactonase
MPFKTWLFSRKLTTAVLFSLLPVVVTLGGCGGQGGSALSKSMRTFSNYLFVANNGADGVAVFGIDGTSGSLASAGTIANGTGNKARSVAVDSLSRFLYVANASTSTVSGFSLDLSTGSGASISGSPFGTGSTPTDVVIDNGVKLAYLGNQGSSNVTIYAVGSSGDLAQTASSPLNVITPPQAIVVHPSGKFLYVATSSGIFGFIATSLGNLTPISLRSPLTTVSASAMVIAPSGAFLYATIPSSSLVVVFAVDNLTGLLTQAGAAIPTGSQPASIAIDFSGCFIYVANTGSNSVSTYQTDKATGILTTGSSTTVGTGSVSVVVEPLGKFVYVANSISNNISAFALAADSGGSLTPLPGSPISTGLTPVALATTHLR